MLIDKVIIDFEDFDEEIQPRECLGVCCECEYNECLRELNEIWEEENI